ncbi:GNAT family N-acetyltransferase [Aliikangiella sp. IMCC44359]|uniref:GNAT family N-acetyltransferase n=1 Tax=Aliikangiella sp. IMCC44359 TaxID=3459125 RepID=UPI00403B1A13
MTRNLMSIPSSEFLEWQQQLKKANIRGLILTAQNLKVIEQLKKKLDEGQSSTIIFNQEANHKNQLFSSQLGNEFDVIFINAQQYFDSNLFAAACGTLVGGGYLVLTVPDILSDMLLEIIKQRQSLQPDYSTIIPKLLSFNISPTLLRVILFSLKNQYLSIMTKHLTYYSTNPPPSKVSTTRSNQEQRLLIQKIIKVAKGHAKRPLVITANRGRGKSASLGIAASKLLQHGNIKIIVTAPHINNLNSFYKHLVSTENNNKDITYDGGAELVFIPLDQIIANKPHANLLLIDEAAAIPVFQLEQIIERYNRIVFATTTDGYEGNGKGFEIRFKQKLIQKYPQTRFASLYAPVRWSDTDELEKSCFKALLLGNQLKELNKTTLVSYDELYFRLVDKSTLKYDENLLTQIFVLLINAHYQTRPADLERILTDNNLLITTLTDRSGVIHAVALICQEGNLNQTIIQTIYESKKRLKGELLPQSLIANYGMQNTGKMSFYRIMRIAVHPSVQSNHIGSDMISEINNLAIKNNIDFIGASFAVDPKIIKFWFKNGFSLIRFGNARDSSTGAFTCEVIKTINSQLEPITKQLVSRLNESFLYKLNGSLKLLQNGVIQQLLQHQLIHSKQPISQYELEEITMFTRNARSYSMVDWLLVKLLTQKINHLYVQSSVSAEDAHFLIDFILKQQPFNWLSTEYQLTGKKQILAKLKKLISALLGD